GDARRGGPPHLLQVVSATRRSNRETALANNFTKTAGAGRCPAGLTSCCIPKSGGFHSGLVFLQLETTAGGSLPYSLFPLEREKVDERQGSPGERGCCNL